MRPPSRSRRRHEPRPLRDLLAVLASKAGTGALLDAEAEAAVREAMGPWLAGKLARVERAGSCWRIFVARDARAEVENLREELVAALGARCGDRAPATLDVRSAEAPRRAAPEPAATPGETRQPGPLAAEALRRLPDDEARRRLERLAATWRRDA